MNHSPRNPSGTQAMRRPTPSDGGPGTAVRVTPSRRRADEWAVVLAAADIPHWLRQRLDGWAVFVEPVDADAALDALAAYDRENAPERAVEIPASRPFTIVGLVVALLLIGFFAVTGPRAERSAWFERGSADAARMVAGEWWRAVTALTLHADGFHVLGNAAGVALLVTAVCEQIGPGVGLALEPGDVLSVRTPGGGGHGDRLERPPAHVLADVAAGLVSPAHAREAYGVVVAGDRVDETATAALRTARRGEPPAGDATDAGFDFGPARRAHERRWPPRLQDAFIALLMRLPAPYRAYVRRTLYPRVEALATQRPVTADDLERLWQELRGAIGLR